MTRWLRACWGWGRKGNGSGTIGGDLRRIKWRSSVRGGFLSEVRIVTNYVQRLCLEHEVGDKSLLIERGSITVCGVEVCT